MLSVVIHFQPSLIWLACLHSASFPHVLLCTNVFFETVLTIESYSTELLQKCKIYIIYLDSHFFSSSWTETMQNQSLTSASVTTSTLRCTCPFKASADKRLTADHQNIWKPMGQKPELCSGGSWRCFYFCWLTTVLVFPQNKVKISFFVYLNIFFARDKRFQT